MIELAIAMAVSAYVVRHGAELVAAITGKQTDWQKAQAHRIESRTAARAARAARAGQKTPKQHSAFWDYLALLWEDGWTDAKSKHSVRRSRRLDRQASSPSSNGSMRGFARQVKRDGWNWWDRKWDEATERRTAKTRPYEPSPSSPTVPGITVPDAGDLSGDQFVRHEEDGTKPQSEPRTAQPSDPKEPATAKPPCSNCNPIHLHDDQCAIKTSTCPKCYQEGVLDHGMCLTCWEQEQYGHVDEDGQRLAWQVTYPNGQKAITDDPRIYRRKNYPVRAVRGYDRDHGFLITDRPTTRPEVTATPTTEGTTMSTPNTEATGLDSSVQFCQDGQNNASIVSLGLEQLAAFLESSKVEGAVFGHLASAKEHYDAASASLQAAESELRRGYGVREAYEAAQGAGGDKQYVEAN